MAQENTYKNMTGSGVVCGGGCVLHGMYVNSTTSGTIKLYNHATAASGDVINNTMTPAIGWHFLGNVRATNGVYVSRGGTAIDVTFCLKATN